MTPVFGSSITEVHRDIEYARPNGESLKLDASVPGGEGPFAAAIVVHGGGWVRGDRRADVAPILDALTEAGVAWFSIDYRLMNDISQFGVAVDDIEAAVRFVKRHARLYHVDPNRIVLIGESAGGQLAAMAALNEAPDLRVRGVAAFYAPTDLVTLAKNSAFVPQEIRTMMQGSPFGVLVRGRLAQLSPIENVHAGMPPFLLVHGSNDSLVPFAQSRAFCEKVKGVGAACELYEVSGAGHGLRWWQSTAYKSELLRWLKRQTSDQS